MKTPKEYQKEFRERMKAAGWVKREVHIPENMTPVLKQVEVALRKGIIPMLPTKGESRKMWTVETLKAELDDASDSLGLIAEKVNGADDTLVVRFEDSDDQFPIIVAVNGETIVASTVLFATDEVSGDVRARVNEVMLGMNPVIPLSAFGLLGGNYVLYGELSALSKFETIVVELQTLSQNVVEALTVVSEVVS